MTTTMPLFRGKFCVCAGMTLLVSAGLYGTAALGAEAPDLLKEPFIVSLGSYVISADTSVRVDGDAGERGTRVNWERTFGGGDLTRFRVDLQWRFAEHHKLRALWFNSDRSKTKTIDREINWGDTTFPVDARLKGNINYDIYELAYEYAFFRRDTYELSASIGAYYGQFNASLAGDIASPDGTSQIHAKADASINAPLPVLGLRGQWLLPYNLSLDVSGQWFKASINQYNGDLQDYRGTLTWQPKEWLGIGFGYDYFSAHGDTDSHSFKGSLDWTFQGPMIYYSAAF
jgi:hypothetical protein